MVLYTCASQLQPPSSLLSKTQSPPQHNTHTPSHLAPHFTYFKSSITSSNTIMKALFFPLCRWWVGNSCYKGQCSLQAFISLLENLKPNGLIRTEASTLLADRNTKFSIDIDKHGNARVRGIETQVTWPNKKTDFPHFPLHPPSECRQSFGRIMSRDARHAWLPTYRMQCDNHCPTKRTQKKKGFGEIKLNSNPKLHLRLISNTIGGYFIHKCTK